MLYFEGDPTGEYRIVRAYKNRFGGIDEICVFAMDDRGLHEIADPSALFLHGRGPRPSGSCVVPTLVGPRPVLVEIQALVGEAAYGTPRRLAANVDAARLAMIIAILERRAGMQLGGHDVYCSVAGGLRVDRDRRRPRHRARDRVGVSRRAARGRHGRVRRARPLGRSARRRRSRRAARPRRRSWGSPASSPPRARATSRAAIRLAFD